MTESILRSIDSAERQAEAFPLLTPSQIDRIRPYGTVRTVRAGEILFEAGDGPCFGNRGQTGCFPFFDNGN